MDNLKGKVENSLFWSFGDQLVSQFIFVIFSIYLARILDPSVFGVVGMVTVFTNFAALFIDMGFGAALVQKKDVDEGHYSSVFWLNLFIGIALFVLFYFSAPLISEFYNNLELISIIRVMCLSFIISSLISVQSNILVKELNFRRKVIYNWIASIFGYALAFYLAKLGYGVWVLVAMTLGISIVTTILYWIGTTWRPKFIFKFSKIKELSNFGLNYLGDSTINYWSRNYDNFIIGKVLGQSELGLYSRAYSLMMLPLRNITSVFSKVLFPAFSKFHYDLDKIKRSYLKLITVISFITFPMMIGLSLVSEEFVTLFFGEKWLKMIPLLALLSILGAIQSIISLNGLIYNSLGKSHIAFRVSLLVNFVLILTFTLTVKYGILVFTYSYLISSLIISVPVYIVALKQINTTIWEVLYQIKGVILSLIGMVLVIYLISLLDLNLLYSFIIKLIAGGGAYLLGIVLFEKQIIILIKNFIFSRLNSKRRLDT